MYSLSRIQRILSDAACSAKYAWMPIQPTPAMPDVFEMIRLLNPLEVMSLATVRGVPIGEADIVAVKVEELLTLADAAAKELDPSRIAVMFGMEEDEENPDLWHFHLLHGPREFAIRQCEARRREWETESESDGEKGGVDYEVVAGELPDMDAIAEQWGEAAKAHSSKAN